MSLLQALIAAKLSGSGGGGGGGGSVTVDAALSASSENPVQNKVITSKINQMASLLDRVVHDGKDGNKTYICTNFDSAETYAVGDYVMYSSALYECTTAHTGAWNASHFTAVTLNEGDLICNTDENSSVAWSDITGKPTTLAGYGITDAEAKGKITINGTEKTASSHTLSWTDNGTTYSYEVVTV
jgi:hypothetical protein